MPWFRNFYQCSECGTSWHNESKRDLQRRLPVLRCATHVAGRFDDLTYLIEGDGDRVVVMSSVDDAEDSPDYRRVVPCREHRNGLMVSLSAD